MIVDCNECVVRGAACSDCVVTVLLGMPTVGDTPAEAPSAGRRMQLDQAERIALEALAAEGMVPRLRLVTTRKTGETDAGSSHEARHTG